MNLLQQLRVRLAGWRWRAEQCWHFQKQWGVGLTWPSRLKLAQAHWLHLAGSARTWRMSVPGYRYPVHFRTGSSDLAVIQENLLHKQYQAVSQLADVRTIVDLGGNIGTASFYLLHRYPEAQLLFVEPDPRNLQIARKTLKPFASRVQFVEGGVWSHTGPLKLSREGFRDSAEWSVQVRPARPEETPDVQAFSLPDLFKLARFDRIDLLKVDIEAAEQVVFQHVDEWLSRVQNIIIEIHDQPCNTVVSQALSGFHRHESGELSVFHRKTPRTS